MASSDRVRQGPLRRERLAILALLALLTVAAWGLTLSQMGAMGGSTSGQGGETMGGQAGMAGLAEGAPMGSMAMPLAAETEPGLQLVVFLGTWVVMMAAMMLPSAAPMILLFGTVYRRQREQGRAFVPTWVFVTGYLAVWTAFGANVYGLSLFGADLARTVPSLGALGPRLAALAMLAAGLYQLTPLKERCLAHCRSPLHFILEHWRPGMIGALRMGARHGLYCVGCCWVLMLLLIAIGLGSLPWMALTTLVIFAEKLLPSWQRVSRVVAAALVGLGLLTLAQPALLQPLMG